MIVEHIGGAIIKKAPGTEKFDIERLRAEKLTRLAFMERFTGPEMVAIYTAAKTSVELEIFLDKVRAAEEITVTDPRTIAGVESLVAAGLVAPERLPEILRVEL